jgi:hypothetical protein
LERRVDSKPLSKFHNTDVLGYTILVLFVWHPLTAMSRNCYAVGARETQRL